MKRAFSIFSWNAEIYMTREFPPDQGPRYYVAQEWINDHECVVYGTPQESRRKAKRILNRARKGKVEGTLTC